MRHFISAITTNRVKPRAIILTNEAIHLALEGSEVLPKLTALEEQGTRIMVCVTSTDTHPSSIHTSTHAWLAACGTSPGSMYPLT